MHGDMVSTLGFQTKHETEIYETEMDETEIYETETDETEIYETVIYEMK